MNQDFVLNVSEADFEYEVINYSQNVPVVVDFWAEWCGPCKLLGPILERLARESGGSFRLAKVDVDANPNLALRFGVRGIPNVKAFSGGQVVAEFTGMVPEDRVREFIRKIAPSQHSLDLEKAISMVDQHEWKAAEQLFHQVLSLTPEQPAALLGLTRSYIAQGKTTDAFSILKRFPPSREYSRAETLRSLVDVISGPDHPTPEEEEDDPFAPAYYNAIRLIRRGHLVAAIDGLLDILRQDKRYRDGLVRQMVIGALEVLGDADPQTRQYRNELASILF